MTMAEVYRRTKPESFASALEWAQFILAIDREAKCMQTDIGLHVVFSDGSHATLHQKERGTNHAS